MRIAGAPISWGVSEVAGWGRQLPLERVLNDMRRLGLVATEAGPPGFLAADPGEARSALERRGLRLVGGFVTAMLHVPQRLPQQIERLTAQARWLAEAGGEMLVLAAAAGGDGYDARTQLDAREWATLFEALATVRDVAIRGGLRLAVHPHFGTAIETADDIERLLAGCDAALCLDTGHASLGGADPADLATRHGARVAHVHLKDVDPSLAERVRTRALGYAEGVGRGLFRPLGRGAARIAEVLASLRARGYDGWYVLEQDVALGADSPDPLKEIEESLEFARARA